MATNRKPTVEPYHAETGTSPEPPGFDVTCVIGRVTLGHGPEYEAASIVAFKLIAEHGAPGVYTFPEPHGSVCKVTVEYIDPPKDEEPERYEPYRFEGQQPV